MNNYYENEFVLEVFSLSSMRWAYVIVDFGQEVLAHRYKYTFDETTATHSTKETLQKEAANMDLPPTAIHIYNTDSNYEEYLENKRFTDSMKATGRIY